MNRNFRVRLSFWIALVLALVVSVVLPMLWTSYSASHAEERAASLSPGTEDLEKSVMASLAKDERSPETLESAALLFHQGLLLAVQGRYERGDRFFDAMPTRFPDSPYIQKVESLRPLIETAKTGEQTPEAIEARARLAVEALPLAITSTFGFFDTARFSQTNTTTMIDAWWARSGGYKITCASPDSAHALWPIKFEKIESASYAEFYPGSESGSRMEYFYGLQGVPMKPTPIDVLIEIGMSAVPILRAHLDDSRLCFTFNDWNMFNRRMGEPTTVGRTCFDILCAIAGFYFDDSELLASNSPWREVPTRNDSYKKENVLQYIDRWWNECSNAGRVDSIRWHVEHTDLSADLTRKYVLEMGKIGAREEALERLRALHDPQDVLGELHLADAMTQLGDASLLPRVLDNYKKGNYRREEDSHVSPLSGYEQNKALSLLKEFGSENLRKDVLDYLHQQHNPNDIDGEMRLIGTLLEFDDKSLLPKLVQNYREGLYTYPKEGGLFDSRIQRAVSLITNYGDEEQKRVIIERCKADAIQFTSDFNGTQTEREQEDCRIQLRNMWELCEGIPYRAFDATGTVELFVPFLELT
ncbi:MAG: hypothetical protein ABIH23_02375, partial [bacterium]